MKAYTNNFYVFNLEAGLNNGVYSIDFSENIGNITIVNRNLFYVSLQINDPFFTFQIFQGSQYTIFANDFEKLGSILNIYYGSSLHNGGEFYLILKKYI